jgi:hypothetical protein
MRARKVDSNQAKIVSALRDIPGVSVAVTSSLGDGFVDLVIGTNLPGMAPMNYLIEVKDEDQPPSKRKLTEAEERFHKTWKGPKAVCKNLNEVLTVIGIKN